MLPLFHASPPFPVAFWWVPRGAQCRSPAGRARLDTLRAAVETLDRLLRGGHAGAVLVAPDRVFEARRMPSVFLLAPTLVEVAHAERWRAPPIRTSSNSRACRQLGHVIVAARQIVARKLRAFLS